MPPRKTTRIRTGYKKHEPYPVNQITSSVLAGIGKRIVHRKAVGMSDLVGDDFCRIFAEAISGENLSTPVGIADVVWNGCCWSVKTIKNKRPHLFTVGKGADERPKRIRLISGRNSPAYSSGISDPMADPQETGQSVLNIYNSRIGEAREKHDDVRLLVFVRNWETQEFTIFERSVATYAVNDYVWSVNDKQNLVAHKGNEQVFTWQPHGSQFTIHMPIPESAIRFKLTQTVPLLEMQQVLQFASFKPEWIEII